MNKEQLYQEMTDTVENNILRFWLDHMVDHEQGGFYGQMRGDGTLVKDAVKGGILLARILWTFAAAYRVLKKEEYLAAAIRAKDYLLTHFYDDEYGGIYWTVDYKGQPLNTKKQTYALGFALYGLSEYARATGDREVLDRAIDLFNTIETHALDHEYNGYIEARTRQWQAISDMRLSDKDANYPKSQNTHLHILEPYTNLYRCLKELNGDEALIDKVGQAIRNLIDIFCIKIINPQTHHLGLFFDMDWTPRTRVESFGHDIECSWLLHEAARQLAEKSVIAKVVPVVKNLAQAAEQGLTPDGAMICEVNNDTKQVESERQWWVQAETIVGYYNIYQYFNDEQARLIAMNTWQYTKRYIINYEQGEWHWSCDENNRTDNSNDRAGFWKCPYHNSRMCLELIERLNK